MSLVEVNRIGNGQVIKVRDTAGGRNITLFLVDLYSRLTRPPSRCDERLTAQDVNIELCHIKVSQCVLTILITGEFAEVIGGALIIEGGLTARPEEAREICERSISILEKP
ncbi:MAG: hypothetical protein ACP5HK_05490 [Acidilobus sp.]